MANTLEQRLQRQLAQGATDDDFVVKQLRRQIAAKKVGRLQSSYTSRVQLKNKKAAWRNKFTVASNIGGISW